MIQIHRLHAEDLMGLKALYEDAFGGVSNYDKMTGTFDKINHDENHIVLCAKEDGRIVGSILGVICNELIAECTPFMVLEDIAVLSTWRRKGVAKKLIQEMEHIAITKECNMILFVSSRHREGAHKLYESLGFDADPVNGYRKRLQ